MEMRKVTIPIVIIGLAVLVAAGAFMLRATAQDRPLGTGPLPTPVPQPTIVPKPTAALPAAPTSAPSAQNSQAQRTVESFDAAVKNWEALNPNSMQDQQGTWQVSNGTLQAKAPLSESFDDSIYLAPVDTAGLAEISTKVYAEGNQTVGVVFRASDKGYYLFRIFRATENGKALNVLQRYDAAAGTYTDLARNEQGPGYVLNKWQSLQVEVNNDLITCFFEGQKIFEEHDTTFSNGKAGVYALSQGDVQFDNFTIVKP